MCEIRLIPVARVDTGKRLRSFSLVRVLYWMAMFGGSAPCDRGRKPASIPGFGVAEFLVYRPWKGRRE